MPEAFSVSFGTKARHTKKSAKRKKIGTSSLFYKHRNRTATVGFLAIWQ
jgi:hypothetical protein